MRSRRLVLFAAALAILAIGIPLLAGCGSSSGGQPTFIVFMSKDSKSYAQMKPIVDKLQAKYKGKVVFKYYDYNDPKAKSLRDNTYHVSMNPTFIMLNAQGKVKEIFMGAAQEEMLSSSIESFIPGQKPASTTPGAPPGLPTQPGSMVQTLPVNPVPQTTP